MAGFLVGHPRRSSGYRNVRDLFDIGTLLPLRWLQREWLILRYREPNRPPSLPRPGGPIAPIITIVNLLTANGWLPIMNWIRFFVWMAIDS